MSTDPAQQALEEQVYELRRKAMRHTSASMHAYDFKCACELCQAMPTVLALLAALHEQPSPDALIEALKVYAAQGDRAHLNGDLAKEALAARGETT